MKLKRRTKIVQKTSFFYRVVSSCQCYFKYIFWGFCKFYFVGLFSVYIWVIMLHILIKTFPVAICFDWIIIIIIELEWIVTFNRSNNFTLIFLCLFGIKFYRCSYICTYNVLYMYTCLLMYIMIPFESA